MRLKWPLLITGGLVLTRLVAQWQAPAPPLRTVAFVDLQRYAGVWYEIARLPNRFEQDCAANITATYTLRADGQVDVLNQCQTRSGQVKRSAGRARVVDPATNAKLKVTFFWPFAGDYWILELGPQYEYAVIGEPKRDYLWILSRNPQMQDELYEELLQRAATQGFDVRRMRRTS
jgi:apolipoprotein D and lipocalin family protein